jgi:YHS domain-containing protein
MAMGRANTPRETNLVAYNQPMDSTSFRPSATPNTYGAQPVSPPTSALPPRQESNYATAPYGSDSRIGNANVYGSDAARAAAQPQAGAYDPQGYRGTSAYGGAAPQTPPNTYGGSAPSAAGERPSPYRNNSSFQPERPGGAYVEGTPYHYPEQQYGRQAVQPQNPVSAINQSAPNLADPHRPTQSQLSGSMYGQPELGASAPRRDGGAYGGSAYGGNTSGSPRETANISSAPPERNSGLNGSSWQENPQQAALPPSSNPGQALPSQTLPGQTLPGQSGGHVSVNPHVGPAPAPAGQDVRSSVSVAPPQGNPPLAIEGFCPVSLMESSKWNKGDVRFGAIHRGRTYLFASPNEQQKFLANPDQYSPMLSGYDPVAYLEQGKMVDGRRQCGIVHDGKMYLFTDEASLQRFCEAPDRFTGGVRQAMQQSIVPTTRR